MRTTKNQVTCTLRVVVPCRHALGVLLLHAGSCRSAVSHGHAAPYRDIKIVSQYKTPSRALCAMSRSLLTVSRTLLHCVAVLPLALACRLSHVAPWCMPVCRDTILLYRDQSWKMGSSLSSFLSCTFFFFVPLCTTYCKTTNFIFIFSYLPAEPQKLIYFFIFFFPILHTVKPTEKFSSIFFFYSSSSLPATSNYNPFSCAKTGIIFQNSKKTQLFMFKN